MALLEVENLRTQFRTDDGVVQAVDGVSFTVERGATLGDRRRVRLREERHLPDRDGAERSS